MGEKTRREGILKLEELAPNMRHPFMKNAIQTGDNPTVIKHKLEVIC